MEIETKIYLVSEKGNLFLVSHDGWNWLETSEAWVWLWSSDGKAWLKTDAGKAWAVIHFGLPGFRTSEAALSVRHSFNVPRELLV